jgi:hypothetical protein
MNPVRRKAMIAFITLILSGLAIAPAFAKIQEVDIACTNPAGQSPGGQQPSCQNDNLDQESENQNPAGHAPGGHN